MAHESKYPGILEPTTDAESLRQALSLIKEGLEMMQGIRGDPLFRVPTYDEMLEFGIITQEDFNTIVGRG